MTRSGQIAGAPPAPTAPAAPAATGKGASSARWAASDGAFAGLFALYLGYCLAVLLAGAVSAAALPTGLHEALHVRGFSNGIVGRVAEAVADAAHHAQPGPQLALDYGFSLFNLALAALLLWLRPRDLTARLLAVAMVGTAAIFNLQAYGVYEALAATPLDMLAHDLFHFVAAISYGLALLLFPDGPLVPRWRAPAVLVLYAPLVAALVILPPQIQNISQTLVVIMVFGLATPLVGVASQAYRYRQSQGQIERQQARLLFWALAPALLLTVLVLLGGVTDAAVQNFQGREIPVIPTALFRVFQPIFAIIPVALFVGILRFRLWDVDRFITRTLAYGALAVFVGLVYVAVVVGLGRIIGTRSDNVLLSIVATGIVAVAFEPVRERVQHLANRLVYGHRATPYEALSTFSSGMGETVATEEKLSRLAQILAEGTGARTAFVWLVVGDELRCAATYPEDRAKAASRSIRLDGQGLPALRNATAAVPVLHEGELLGALSIRKPVNESLAPAEEKLLGDLAAQAGLLLRNVRLTAELLERLEELRASRQRLLAAQDEARRRLERNLHDGAQQQLVALKVRLGLAERMAEQGKPIAPLLHQLADDTGEAIDNLRDLARGIYPSLLAAEGLPTALRGQARKTPIPVSIVDEGIGRYDQDIEAAVYFCCLEALQNVVKYAGANRAVITLAEDHGVLSFTISDDGEGFDSETAPRGSGLQNMADRLDALDGSLRITATPGGGTTVSGSVPIRPRGPGVEVGSSQAGAG
jgi:signal transduction histidine kinase